MEILIKSYINVFYFTRYENQTVAETIIKNNPILVKINKIDDTGKKSKSKFSDNGDIQILSPLQNSRVLNEDLFISLSYFKLKNINKDETRVFLNNRDITAKITFYDNYFIYKPDKTILVRLDLI